MYFSVTYPAINRPCVNFIGRRLGEGFDVWLDEKNILPGQDWDVKIRQAVRVADLVIVCLSRASIGKTGYVQREIRMVLDLADEQPEDKIYLIPARLEECEVPHRLTRWQWVDLFDPEGYDRLLSAMRTAAARLDLPATADELEAHRSPQVGSVASRARMPETGGAHLPTTPVDDTSLRGAGPVRTRRWSQGSGAVAAEAMTSPHPGRGGAADSNEPRETLPQSLPVLRDHKVRLSDLLENVDMSPDSLDPQADEVHQVLVMPVYEKMRTEVARGGRARTHLTGNDSPIPIAASRTNGRAYREALDELQRARIHDTSFSDAMVRLERPRSEYIAALLSFHAEFSATLDFLFPERRLGPDTA